MQLTLAYASLNASNIAKVNNKCIKNVLERFVRSEIVTIVIDGYGADFLGDIENPSYIVSLHEFEESVTTKHVVVFMNNTRELPKLDKAMRKKYRSNFIFVSDGIIGKEVYEYVVQFNITKLLVLNRENEEWFYEFYSPFGANNCFKYVQAERSGSCDDEFNFNPFLPSNNLTGKVYFYR